MIKDEKVKQIVVRPDLDKNEKLVLLDILAREPEPEKVKGAGPLGQTEIHQGRALATIEQIATRTGLSEPVVKRTIRKLAKRKLITRFPSKGRTPSGYLVNLN
ncbi:MAG: hypothetical protein WAM96_10820 [Candidatus Acidiferrales bacterium]